jgi:hypothetical protein
MVDRPAELKAGRIVVWDLMRTAARAGDSPLRTREILNAQREG